MLQVETDPWPRNSICHREAKKEKEKKKKILIKYFQKGKKNRGVDELNISKS